MKNNYWKNNGSSKNPLYDFTPITSLGDDGIKMENKKIIENIINKEIKKYPWIKEIIKFPDNLLSILIEELKYGNSIASINNSNWPQVGSIVIKLNNRFRKEIRSTDGTRWRLLNDPHYCNEEVSEISENIEFLLIN